MPAITNETWPKRWSKPYTRWSAADWRAEGMSRADFVAAMRNDLVDAAGEVTLYPTAELIAKLRPVARDAFGSRPESMLPFENLIDEQTSGAEAAWIRRELEEQVLNASAGQILAYAWSGHGG